MKKVTTEKILSLLPQTQCQKCGYNSCHDYANAIAKGAPINCCPTGGEEGIKRLSRLTKRPLVSIDPLYGEEQPHHIVFVDESLCVGCELCIKACPVDAIIGTQGLAHSILVQQCTGCDLCIKACPVDCILTKTDKNHTHNASRAKTNYEKRQKRLKEQKEKQTEAISQKEDVMKRKSVVAEAIEKARKLTQKTSNHFR